MLEAQVILHGVHLHFEVTKTGKYGNSNWAQTMDPGTFLGLPNQRGFVVQGPN